MAGNQEKLMKSLNAQLSRVGPDKISDYAETLRALTNMLREVGANASLRADPDASKLYQRILKSRNPTELDELVDQLMVRVGKLIEERTGDNRELHRLSALTGPRRRLPISNGGYRGDEDDPDDFPAPAKTIMRL